ncbi:glycerophosphodiester phosphodiesterase [Halopiger goleimassiliensis]|uniref:glycerophosphodiester phosphodiesterase n=1 Tax=Halopiger goleimassiliensis TaxID=1293048 RepID=UPI0018A83A0A|nr:glycerophosphodiester phosphodiesterase family protein [Halopiger goleimassiliensis]
MHLSAAVGLSTGFSGCLGRTVARETELPIQAHRCFGSVYPENTVRAAVLAAEVADQIEFDVRRCGSGEIVVFHDERVDRLTDETGPVSEFDAQELRRLHVADSDERIPLLSEMLEAIPGECTANIELKEPGLAADAIRKGRAADPDIVISSLEPDLLREAENAPGRDDVETALVGVGTVGDSYAEGIATAAAIGCDRVHLSAELVANTDAVSLAHREGLWVNSATLRTSRGVDRMRQTPVDGLSGDRPDIF